MDYYEVKVKADEQLAEVLTAELAQLDYEAFTEDEGILSAYVQSTLYNAQTLQQLMEQHGLAYETVFIEAKNWNAEWESNFEPVQVDGRVYIRATFHEPQPGYDYEIVIDPKMSFGTGHHATTSLMVSAQLKMDNAGKRVLDAGTGTGILAIMAAKLGAAYVNAFDIDEWPVNNAIENAALNDTGNIEIWQGTIANMAVGQPYDIVLANINRNILLAEMPTYAKHLAANGLLALSGFYSEDIPAIQEAAGAVNLTLKHSNTLNNWACLVFENSKKLL